MSDAPRPTDSPPTRSCSPVRWPVYLAALAVPLIAAGVWLWLQWGKPGTSPVDLRQPAVAGWEPRTDEDWQLDEAVRRLNEGGADRHRLLGPPAVFDDRPIDEPDADARQADFFLRHPKLQITAIHRGERVRGKLIERPHYYTLGTRVDGSTPPLRIRNDRGGVDAPSRLFMMNPDLVVELRDGQVIAVRPELKGD